MIKISFFIADWRLVVAFLSVELSETAGKLFHNQFTLVVCFFIIVIEVKAVLLQSTIAPMSNNQQNNPTPLPLPKTRKQVVKKLSTGHKIHLTTQDERTLRSIYEFLAGYANRRAIETALEAKKVEVNRLHHALPPSARLLLQMQPKAGSLPVFGMSTVSEPADPKGDVAQQASGSTTTSRNEADLLLDEYYRAKDHMHKLEEKLKVHTAVDHKISFKDLDAVLRSLGPAFSKKQIEQMIWEVDENLDEMIDFDELQLTYYRNITDSTGSEPCYFFKILEFLICDASHKGYIIEDDCMEVLYARYGGGVLENEMRLLFGTKLRAEGGDGTLNLEA